MVTFGHCSTVLCSAADLRQIELLDYLIDTVNSNVTIFIDGILSLSICTVPVLNMVNKIWIICVLHFIRLG